MRMKEGWLEKPMEIAFIVAVVLYIMWHWPLLGIGLILAIGAHNLE